MSKSNRVIGINALTYPEIRNFAGHKFNNYTFKKVYDWYKIPSFLLYKFKKKINRKWQNSFFDFGFSNCNLLHFFNVINLGPQPYITTYETTLPRWRDTDEDFKDGLELLAKNNCAYLIALSDCAYRKQLAIVQKFKPHLLDTIVKKSRVLLPPQVPLIGNMSAKRPVANQIVFTIVGADFFRKGGKAILEAFDMLLSEEKPVKLNIVSTLNYGDYASKSNLNDYEKTLQIIRKHPDNIQWFEHLDNAKVIQLLQNTDVALLPSLAETFGYFILEAQAAGCPVITTDIRAMPEINNSDKGWLIKTAMDNANDADLSDPTAIHQTIVSGLLEIIRSIISDPSIIRRKGELALQDIVLYHSPEKHKEILFSIYETI